MKNTEIPFEKFEKSIMNKLLKGNEPNKKVLVQQYNAATVEKREFSGKGFYTHFKIPTNTPKLSDSMILFLDNIGIRINDINIEVMLFVNNGFIDFLEGYVLFDDTWPNIISTYEFYDTKGNVIEKHC